MNEIPLRRYLPQAATATFLVAVCPVLAVWWLRSSGVIESALVGMLVAIGLSLGSSYLGRLLWETRSGTGDVLFAELMVWGFVRRWRSERRLASAMQLLGSMNDAQRRFTDGLTAESQAAVLEKLSAALEATDPHTHGHSRRVARHSWMIARQMGLRGETVARIRTAAALHDVGKIETPASILRKRGPLTDDEFGVIKLHPVDGARMVGLLGDPQLESIVHHHHERLDGTGYPDGLPGEQIPLGARIIAVADTFDAITSARPYRSARSHKKAVDVLKYEAGTQLDPSVVRAFCSMYSGRRPLALWTSVTSLPAQVFSWLAGGVAGAASVAQVAAISAVAAVGAVTVARPAGHPQPKRPSAGLTAATGLQTAVGVGGAEPARVLVDTGGQGARGQLTRGAAPTHGLATTRGSATHLLLVSLNVTPTSAQQLTAPAVTSRAPGAAPPAGGPGSPEQIKGGARKTEEPTSEKLKSEKPNSEGGGEAPKPGGPAPEKPLPKGKAKAKEPKPEKPKPEKPAGKGGGEEPKPEKPKPEKPAGKGGGEEPKPEKPKPEKPAGKGKGEEPKPEKPKPEKPEGTGKSEKSTSGKPESEAPKGEGKSKEHQAKGASEG